MAHKFEVGQVVDFEAPRGEGRASSRGYKILRLLPSDNGPKMYRIKSAAEVQERVAKESSLKVRSGV